MREIETEHADLRKRRTQRVDAVVARPVAAPDQQGLLVEPDRVAAVRRRRCIELRDDRHPRTLEVGRDRFYLHEPAFLAWAKDDRAAVGHDRRIEDVDRIGVGANSGLRKNDLGACPAERRAERIVLRGELLGVGLGPPAVLAPGREANSARRADEHTLQLLRHVLAAEESRRRRAHPKNARATDHSSGGTVFSCAVASASATSTMSSPWSA